MERQPPPNANEYETPRGFFARLDFEFRFGLDVFANADNAKCERFLSEERCAFATDWDALRGRLAFEYHGLPLKGNRYDSCLVIFRPGVRGPQFTSMDR